jgi:ABC-type transport system involved in multi-copper enzyme maturation permease subunit
MTMALTSTFSNIFDPARLFGPIFEKELRVSSRRRRNYVLRSVYIVSLTIFLVVAWLQKAQYFSSSGLFMSSRLAAAGKAIIVTIVWFQFCITQVLAVIMLSTAIGEEIYLNTLGVLMTTPMTRLQIVMGKLFSKLLQLILLLAISLPLLAIVRVFGGVSWDYIVSSLCITLTTIVFYGSLSLFFSIFSRKAYIVIIITGSVLGILFGFLLILYMLTFGFFSWGRQPDAPITILFHLNPYMLLALNTDVMLNPRLAGRVSVLLPVHCSFMLAASSVILFASVLLIRKIALAQAFGFPNILRRLLNPPGAISAKIVVSSESEGNIRRVKGPPVVWKELKSRASSRERLFVAIIIGLELALIVAMYLFPVVEDIFGYRKTYMLYICIFIGLGLLTVAIFSATCISLEKEARTWPLLVLTTLSGWQILTGKFVGVVRRSLFVWLLLLVYIGLFWLFDVGVGLFTIAQMAVIVAGSVVFLCGTGFYFSSRFRRTGAAVVTNFILTVLVWGVIPFLVILLKDVFRLGRYFFILDDLKEYCLDVVPFVQAMRVMDNNLSLAESSRFIPTYMLLGFLFAWRAKCHLRHNIF